MRLSREQQAALQQTEREAFRVRVLAQVRRLFPGACASMGDEGTTALIGEGIQRALRHGFSSEQDAFRFITLLIALGPRFDDDPALPWARAIIHDPKLSAWQKMDTLMPRAMAHLQNAPVGESERSHE